MSWFDFFTAKSNADKAGVSRRPRPSGNLIARHARSITKKAQTHDRQAALEALAKTRSGEAAPVLLKRFTFAIDPSITDQDEREIAFRGIVAAGDDALPAIRAFCSYAESVTWPLRIMRELLDDERLTAEIVELLEEWDTEYHRNPEPKTQLLGALERVRDPRVCSAVERFLADFDEPTRFQAVGTLLAQDTPDAAGPLARALVREEAVRTRNRIADGLAQRGWIVPEEERTALAGNLPRGYRFDADGRVVR